MGDDRQQYVRMLLKGSGEIGGIYSSTRRTSVSGSTPSYSIASGRGRVLHCGHHDVQVSDIHQYRNLCAVLGVDERPDIRDSERAEELFPLRGGKPVVCVLHIVVPDDGGHAASLGWAPRVCAYIVRNLLRRSERPRPLMGM